MLQRLSVPIIGVVENMSAFVCPHCGEETESSAVAVAGSLRSARPRLPGQIPLDVTVRQGGDAGVPAVAQRRRAPPRRPQASPDVSPRG